MLSLVKATSFRTLSSTHCLTILLTLAAFAIPISTSLKSILIPLILGYVLLHTAYRRELLRLCKQPWCQASFCLFVLIVCGCWWSPATIAEKKLFIGKYSKLLYLPVLTLAFQQGKQRLLALHAYLLAMVVTCVGSILIARGVLTYSDDPGYVFQAHVVTGYMVAFGTYVAAVFCLQSQGPRRFAYLLLIFLFSYQIFFLSLGKTGYIVYLLLALLLIAQQLSWRQATVAISAGFVVLCCIFYTSTSMRTSALGAIHEWHSLQENQNTSLGYRMQFHAFAKKLFLAHPLLGNGTASFTYLYHELKPVPAWQRTLLEPHSQYWLILVEYGVIGGLIFAGFLISLISGCLQLQSMRGFGLALLIPLLLGCLADSLLLYSGSGVFFLFFLALCLSESKA